MRVVAVLLASASLLFFYFLFFIEHYTYSMNPSTDTETRRYDEIAYNLTSNMSVIVGTEQKLDAGMMRGIQRAGAKSLTKSLQSADAMKSCGVVYYYHTPSTGE